MHPWVVVAMQLLRCVYVLLFCVVSKALLGISWWLLGSLICTHTCTAAPHANDWICEVWFTCDIKWVLHAHFTVKFLLYRFEYANEVACMINEAFHNADGTPKSRRGVLLYITCSWRRIEMISMVMQATNPVNFLENTSAVIASQSHPHCHHS